MLMFVDELGRTLVKVVDGGRCVDAAVPDDFATLREHGEGKEKKLHLVAWSWFWVCR